MAAKISIREIVEALELATDEMSSFVNASTGQVTTVTHEDLRLAEEDATPSDLPQWQQDVVAQAKDVIDSKDWLPLPSKFDIHEWEIMNQFGPSLPNPEARDEVFAAIRGSGAFRTFKITIRRLGVENAWFKYKRRAIEEVARAWLAEKGLRVEGDAVQPGVAPDGASPRR
jgi:hypothetical protein